MNKIPLYKLDVGMKIRVGDSKDAIQIVGRDPYEQRIFFEYINTDGSIGRVGWMHADSWFHSNYELVEDHRTSHLAEDLGVMSADINLINMQVAVVDHNYTKARDENNALNRNLAAIDAILVKLIDAGKGS